MLADFTTESMRRRQMVMEWSDHGAFLVLYGHVTVTVPVPVPVADTVTVSES